MKRKNITYIVLICSMLFANGRLSAQEFLPEPDSSVNPCFSVEELQQLLHMPSSEVYDLLESKGYQMGYYSDKRESEFHDTVKQIELSYTRTIFNDTTDRRSAFWLYRSLDGLSNIISIERRPVKNCSLYGPLHQHDYVYDRQHSIFYGTATYRGSVEHYDVKYYEDSTVMRLTMRNISERDTFVSRQVSAKQALVSAGIARAKRRAADNDFTGALLVLDSLKGVYSPSNTAIETARGYIVKQKENYLYAQMITAANKNNDINQAIIYCDSLLRVDSQNDSLRYVRGLLVDRQRSKLPTYSQFAPVAFDSVKRRLEKVLNDEIYSFPSRSVQRMSLEFNIHTDNDNATRGNITLTSEASGRKVKMSIGERGNLLQAKVRVVTKSEFLHPIVRYGVNIETSEKIKGEVRWQSVERKVRDTCTLENVQLKPFVERVEERYFVTYDTVGLTFNDQGDEPVIKRRVRKPTRRIYTFEVVEKDCNGNRFTDVSLTDFKTSSAVAWVPSLIFPGVGTYNEGVHSSWALRTIPCYLFAAASVAGFMMADKYADVQPEDAVHFWENNKIDRAVGWGGAVFAGAIYINELSESIVYTFRNLNRSKQLRKDLRREAIQIQKENIRLK